METVITVKSGETEAPVAGASIRIEALTSGGRVSQAYTTDSGGRFTVSRDFPLSSTPTLDIQAAGFLDRATLVRVGETSFTLWPRQSVTGLDEQFSSTVVYSSSGCPAQTTGASILRRFPSSVQEVRVAFGTSLQDQVAEAAHAIAITRLNAALSGSFRFVASPGASGDNVFTAEVNPAHSTCTAGPEAFRAATNLTLRNGEIAGGRLTYCTVEAARSVTLVLHELGHAVGLYHSSSQSDVMYCTSGRPADYTARERLALRLARQRRPGNQWPDNDRQVTTQLAQTMSGTATFTCGEAAPGRR
jgi:hypothetical protein